MFSEKNTPRGGRQLPAEWTEQHVAAQLLPRNLGKVFDFLGTDLKVILGDCSLQVFFIGGDGGTLKKHQQK